MKLGKKTVTVYPWHCTCGQELLFEESDFELKCIFEGTANETWLPYINTPCPVCGRLWNNLSKNQFIPKHIEV